MKQYGIRLRHDDDLSYSEFCSLLSGIMPDTPLGQIVSIRAEKDRKVIEKFTEEQKRIRKEWLIRRNQKRNNNPQEYAAYVRQFQTWARAAFSK